MCYRRLCSLVFSLAFTLISTSLSAQSARGINQISPRIIDSNRLDQVGPAASAPTGNTPQGKSPAAVAPVDLKGQSFTLHDLTAEGATVVPPSQLDAVWRGQQGKTVKVQDIYNMADAVAALYARAGYALYSVTVPTQDFRTGHIRIHVTEGHVASVIISGNTKDADLGMLRAQAARIVANRPLRQAVLERNILLMNQIPGLKVGSQFEPVPGVPGAVILKLNVLRTTYEYGADFDNQGNSLLSRTQLDANAAVNSVLREGDRTQLVFGFPLTFDRYQYYGLSHVEPIGSDGAKIGVNLGELVTNSIRDTDAGNALLMDLAGSYPIILSVKESLSVSASFDMLNSNDALLGQTLTDERTRVLRAGLSWAKQDAGLAGLTGVTGISFTVSEGVDILGARRGGPAFGGPDFTKLNLRIGRSQDLPLNLVVRVKAAGQYGFEHLPATEQFAYGGLDFGQAFDTAAVLGDSALAASLELAYKLPQGWFPSFMTGNEVFGFGDYARLFTRDTIYQLAADTGASAGLGVRTKLRNKLGLEMGAANPVIQPHGLESTQRWRFLLQLSGKF